VPLHAENFLAGEVKGLVLLVSEDAPKLAAMDAVCLDLLVVERSGADEVEQRETLHGARLQGYLDGLEALPHSGCRKAIWVASPWCSHHGVRGTPIPCRVQCPPVSFTKEGYRHENVRVREHLSLSGA
jgi:hypothetical protein